MSSVRNGAVRAPRPAHGSPPQFLRSRLHLTAHGPSWACVCGAGRTATADDIPALRDEWRGHQDACRAVFTDADELPLAVIRPGWYDVDAARPCVICGTDTVTRSTRRRPCHVACADRWTAEHRPIPAQRAGSRAATTAGGAR